MPFRLCIVFAFLFNIAGTATCIGKTLLFSFDSSLRFNHPSNYRSVKVLDKRTDITSLRVINEQGKTHPGFGTALSEFGARLVPANNANKDELLIVLKEFTVVPATADNITLITVHASFYRGSEAHYQYLFTIDSFYEWRAMNEHQLWNTQVSPIWFRYFEKASESTPKDTVLYNEEMALGRESALKKTFPAYVSTTYPKGIYFTREEFLQLKPGLSEFDKKSRNASYHSYSFYYPKHHEKEGLNIEDSTYYAAYDGKQWYKSAYTETYRMNFKNGDFFFTAQKTGPRGAGVNHYSAGAFMVFGLIGGSIFAEAMNSSDQKLLQQNPTRPTLYKMKLNIETGGMVPVQRYLIQ